MSSSRSPGAARPRRTSSRRRGSLSREEIVAAGLRIARADDLSRVTMQTLGQELGVTAMALYRHFRDKQELIDAILDHFVREASVTAHGVDPADWSRWLRRTYLTMYDALTDVPGVLPFVAVSEGWRFGPTARATLDESLQVLRDAGFSRAEALECYRGGLAMVVGWAMLEAGGRRGLDVALRRLLSATEHGERERAR